MILPSSVRGPLDDRWLRLFSVDGEVNGCTLSEVTGLLLGISVIMRGRLRHFFVWIDGVDSSFALKFIGRSGGV